MTRPISSEFFIAAKSLKFTLPNDEQSIYPLTIFIRIYFDFTYFLGMSPFRFGREYNGNFVIKKWWLQQIICGTFHVCCTIRLFTEVRLGLRDLNLHKNASPVQYFETVMNLISFAYKFTIMKRFWLNQNEYLSILQVSKRNFVTNQSITPSKFLNPRLIQAFFAIFAFQSILNLAVGKNFLFTISNWTPEVWANRLVELAKYTFFLQEKMSKDDFASQSLHSTSNQTISSSFSESSAVDKILAFFMSLGMLQRNTQGFFTDLWIFSCAMTLWLHANAFSRSVITIDKKKSLPLAGDSQPKEKVDHLEESWEKVYSNFLSMQSLSMAVNVAVGSQVTLYIAESVIYYSLNLNAVLTIANPVRRIDMIYFYILTIGTFVLSADICSQMESIKTWMFHGRNRYKVPLEEMELVLHEMLAKDIGLRGNNVFTITFSFLAAILSTIVTIFIISVQSNDRGGTDESYLTFSTQHEHEHQAASS